MGCLTFGQTNFRIDTQCHCVNGDGRPPKHRLGVEIQSEKMEGFFAKKSVGISEQEFFFSLLLGVKTAHTFVTSALSIKIAISGLFGKSFWVLC